MKTKRRLSWCDGVLAFAVLASVLCSVFVFPNAFVRLVESLRDFGLSVAYYFTELLGFTDVVKPTVTDFSKVTALDRLPIPAEFDVVFFQRYFLCIFSGDNFLNYLAFIGEKVLHVSRVLIFLLPLVVVGYLLMMESVNRPNTDHGKKSRGVLFLKKANDKVFLPIRRKGTELLDFLKTYKIYSVFLFLIWSYNFNVLTILLEAISYYLYFALSFDILHLYTQVVKFILDLIPVIFFVPWPLWVVIILVILDAVAKNQGYKTLQRHEAYNRSFVDRRGVFTNIAGEPNAGKTAMLTDIGLTYETQWRNMSLDIILECDYCFPRFPWILLEDEFIRAIHFHRVYDRYSCKRWVALKKKRFEKHRDCKHIFAYEFEQYGLEYNNGLKTENIWETIEDYCCAFLVYSTTSALILANYSVRVDDIMQDGGNFPLWDLDFFKREAALIRENSRFSHILDFDVFRLGKRMVEDNPQAFAFGYGIYLISEIDKERKNTKELLETKSKTDECNQKNDLTSVCWKMSRHNCVIRNRVFVAVLGDLQRPSALGATDREIGELIYIDDKTEMVPVLPFYSPFWFFAAIHDFFESRFHNFYLTFRYNRGDDIVFSYLYKWFFCKLHAAYVRICNTFGSRKLKLSIQNGRQDGETKKDKYYMQSKKCYSERYSTDCQAGFFERRALVNKVGISDLKEYASVKATWEELASQNSFFQNEVNKLEMQ